MAERRRWRARLALRERRGRLFAALCIVCLVVAGGYVGLVRWRAGAGTGLAPTVVVAGPDALAALRGRPVLVFRNLVPGESYGAVAVARLDALDQPRVATALSCDRLYFAAGRGLCLASNVTPFWSPPSAFAFDADFERGASFPLGELPSRARVAPDGHHAAMTVFVTGDSYLSTGFSTRTTLVDLVSGEVFGDLERFTVTRDGARFQAADFNFWGVTFARDSNRFYATLGTGGHTYLIEGDLAARTARVLREGVECPSLSPDNTRLVFKKRVSDQGWRLHVLDLATLTETPLAETRSVDDQAEWLDDGHVLYGILAPASIGNGFTSDVWMVPADGGETPRVFVPQAASPAVVRPG